MANPYSVFKSLLPDTPLLVGTVQQAVAGGYKVVLLDGGVVYARGVAVEGQQVFVRDDVIEGQAPTLTLVEIVV